MAKLPCLGWNPNQPLHDDNTMSLLTANTWQFPNAFARRHNDSNTNVIHGTLKVNTMHKHNTRTVIHLEKVTQNGIQYTKWDTCKGEYTRVYACTLYHNRPRQCIYNKTVELQLTYGNTYQ